MSEKLKTITAINGNSNNKNRKHMLKSNKQISKLDSVGFIGHNDYYV